MVVDWCRWSVDYYFFTKMSNPHPLPTPGLNIDRCIIYLLLFRCIYYFLLLINFSILAKNVSLVSMATMKDMSWPTE
jgi:hypothetical protein